MNDAAPRLTTINPLLDLSISKRLLELSRAHPEYGYLRLKEFLVEDFPQAQFSNYSVQRMLKRLRLSTYEERLEFREIKKRTGVTPQERLMLLRTGARHRRGVAEVCRKMAISRKTYYKWKKRIEKPHQLELAHVADKPWSISQHPHKFTPEQEKLILSMVKQYPQLSSAKLAQMAGVSNHGVQNVLERHHLNYVADRLIESGKMPVAVIEEAPQKVYADMPDTSRYLVTPQQLPAPPPAVVEYPAVHQTDNLVTPNSSQHLQSFSQTNDPLNVASPVLASSVTVPSYSNVAQKTQSPLLHPMTEVHPVHFWSSFFENVPLSFSVSVLVGGLIAFLIANLYDGSLLAAGIFQLFGVFLAFAALASGFLFFLYSIKYYYSVLRLIFFSRQNLNLNADQSMQKGIKTGLIPNLEQVNLVRKPFISIHLPLYNEKRVVNRLLEAATSLTYENYEIIVCDDSTDETKDLVMEWQNHPKIKISHRESRDGYKGGALKEALKLMDERAEFVMVFDADFLPYPDTIEQFLKYFQIAESSSSLSADNLTSPIAAVQGYQWHVLNKSENWITKGVRTEYAGSYVIERSGTEVYGGLKQIAGSVFMIKAGILKDPRYTWGRSITEDFQLTLKLYRDGYKVVYTPYIQAPSECVSTLKRLIRQRMRWAEGHSFNIKKHFWEVINSKHTALSEKLEFAYLAPYYLQSFFFVVGTICWFTSEVIFRVRLPFWTAVWGWSLVLTNLISLPLMNMVGLFLEEAEAKDYAGIPSFLLLSYILAPFQAYAALKGFIESEEGPWFRTPKTGRITDRLTRGKFYRWVRNLFHQHPVQPALSTKALFVPRMSFNLSFAGNEIAGRSLSKRAKFISRTLLLFLLIVTLSLTSLPRAVPSAQATNPSDTKWYLRDQDTQGQSNFREMYCPSADNCKIVYAGYADQSLRFMDCDDSNCITGTVTVLDSSQAHLAMGIYCPASDDCKVTYYDVNNLLFRDCDNETCSSGTTVTLDGSASCTLTNCNTTDDAGRYSSIYCPTATDCKIAYLNSTNSALYFADCDAADCSSGTITKLDGLATCVLTGCTTGADDIGAVPALNCPTATNCKITYTETTTTAIRFADCDDATCSTGTVTKLDGETGCVATNCSTTRDAQTSTLDCPAEDDCKIAYLEYTTAFDLRVIDCGNSTCTTATSTLADGTAGTCTLTGCAGSVTGIYHSIQCFSTSSCKISYYNSTDTALYFADCTLSSVICDTGTTKKMDGITSCLLTNCSSASASDAGGYTSVYCLSASDCKIFYSFSDGTNNNVKFADCAAADCSSGAVYTIDGNKMINGTLGANTATQAFGTASQTYTIVSNVTYPTGVAAADLGSGTYSLLLRFTNNISSGTLSWNYEVGYCTTSDDCATKTAAVTSSNQSFTSATTSPQTVTATAGSSTSIPSPANGKWLYIKFTVVSAATGTISIRMNNDATNTANSYIDIPAFSVPEFILVAIPVAIFTPLIVRYLRRRRTTMVLAQKV